MDTGFTGAGLAMWDQAHRAVQDSGIWKAGRQEEDRKEGMNRKEPAEPLSQPLPRLQHCGVHACLGGRVLPDPLLAILSEERDSLVSCSWARVLCVTCQVSGCWTCSRPEESSVVGWGPEWAGVGSRAGVGAPSQRLVVLA